MVVIFIHVHPLAVPKTLADKFATRNAETGRYHKARVLEAADSGSKPKIIYTGKVKKQYLEGTRSKPRTCPTCGKKSLKHILKNDMCDECGFRRVHR